MSRATLSLQKPVAGASQRQPIEAFVGKAVVIQSRQGGVQYFGTLERVDSGVAVLSDARISGSKHNVCPADGALLIALSILQHVHVADVVVEKVGGLRHECV